MGLGVICWRMYLEKHQNLSDLETRMPFSRSDTTHRIVRPLKFVRLFIPILVFEDHREQEMGPVRK